MGIPSPFRLEKEASWVLRVSGDEWEFVSFFVGVIELNAGQKSDDTLILRFITNIFTCHFFLKKRWINVPFGKGSVREFFVFPVVLMVFLILFPWEAYAVSAYDGLFPLKQPAGFSFEARQHGDEWYNWVETKDGYGIYQNTATGTWEYYLPSPDLEGANGSSLQTGGPFHAVVGEGEPSFLGIPKGLRPPKISGIKPRSFDVNQHIPPEKKDLQTGGEEVLKSMVTSGTRHLLVIGVDYADAAATYTAGQIQPLLFGDGNSVSDYYRKTSYASVEIVPCRESHGASDDGFIGWLRLSGNHPNTGSVGLNSTANQRIAKDAILAATPYVDYAAYDVNHNGFVEPTELSIMIVVAGYEAAYSSASPSVWAHMNYMDDIGYPFVDGKIIYAYAEFGEKHGNHLATFGVMAHELGHLMFELPDLYDTDTSNGDSAGIGYFDLMGTGSWGAASGMYAGSLPTQLSAWSKEFLSWGTINTISSNQVSSFPNADGNNASIFRMNTTDANQYFLVENRQFTGYDAGFQRHAGASGHGGLVIYHIDKVKTPPRNWGVNADENNKGVDVEEANEGSLGYSMLDTKTYPAHTNMFFFSENNGSFTDTTIPNSKLKNGNSTNISVMDISPNGDTMTATVTVSPPQTGSIRVTLVPQEAVNDGAQWKLTHENAWHDSGAIEYEIPFGTYQVEFKPITGWTTPPKKEIAIFTGNPDVWIDSDPYVRTTVTLTVASSNPDSGVPITISPNDNEGQGNGATQFMRTYTSNTTVTLSAPLHAGGNSFQKWQRNGIDWETGQTIHLKADDNYTVTAVYVTVPTPTPEITPTPVPSPTTTIHPSGLQVFYNFDEGTGVIANDASGNSNHGDIYGALWTTGISGGALSFDGIDDYVDLGNPSNLHPGKVSLSTWFKTTAIGGKIIRKRLYGYCLEVLSSGKVSFWIYNAGATKFMATSPNAYNDNTWHHAIGIYDGSTVKLYIDGFPVASASPGSIHYGSGGIAIGRDGDYSGSYFQGLVDDVRMYNTALSAQEVLALYRQGSGLISHWKLDEGNGTIANDWVTGNNGAINGATWTAGKSEGALSFDGVDDHVEIPGLLGQPQNITISAWANLIVKDTYGAELISLGDHVAIRLDAAGGKGAMGFYYDGTTWRPTTTGISHAGTGWHHFVYVVDTINNVQKIYIDGIEKGSTTHVQSVSYAGLGSNTFIGRHGDGIGNYDFNGVIDDIRVYNRALSEQEIQDLYNAFTISGTMALTSSISNDRNGDSKNLTTTAIPVSYSAGVCSFKAETDNDGRVVLTWEKTREDNNVGFNLYRSRRRQGTYTRINHTRINAGGDAAYGASYSLVDQPGGGKLYYYYKLEDVSDNGMTTIRGPVKVKMGTGNKRH